MKRDDDDAKRLSGWFDILFAAVLLAAGSFLLVFSTASTRASSAAYVLVALGGLTGVRGLWRLVRTPGAVVPLRHARSGLGYKSFVAWRYLLVSRTKVSRGIKLALICVVGVMVIIVAVLSLGDFARPFELALWGVQLALGIALVALIIAGVLRHSKSGWIVFAVGVGLVIVGVVATTIYGPSKQQPVEMMTDVHATLLRVANGVALFGGVLAALALFFGVLRAFFTFFTTVPLGGVWIGTQALVVVLAVMSGFETDLREKILGSNAHLQITKEEGDFTEWREMKAKIDQMPGVVASTPYAMSEVVIAANNTGMPVVIKGIDPKTVGNVTDLVSDLEDRDAMKRLEPLTSDSHDLRVPQQPRTGAVIDPPPPDMPSPGDPIDYSIVEPADPAAGSGAPAPSGSGKASAHPGADAGSGHAGSGSAGSGSAAGEPYGGDAVELVDHEQVTVNDKALDALAHKQDAGKPAIDPPPPDLITSDAAPTDFSQPTSSLPGVHPLDVGTDADDDGAVVKVVDVPFDSPSMSRRTQALPGVLVGRELVKQTHLYTGEEVRVVSPLSDPSNPDATGTPIPFNRDYRVAGTFFTGMYEYDYKYVYVSLDSLQEFLDRGDAVDGIEVRVTNPDDTVGFSAQFAAKFGPGYRVQDWKELNRSLFSALKLEKIAMFLVLGIVILVASFAIVGNLIMVVVEKQKEIALLKTLGASDFGVMQLFAIQGMMIGLIGTVLGIGTGLLICWAAKRFGLPLNPDVYYIDKLPIHVDPASVIATTSAGVLISIAATLYPAVIAARIRPAVGMRH